MQNKKNTPIKMHHKRYTHRTDSTTSSKGAEAKKTELANPILKIVAATILFFFIFKEGLIQ